MTQETDRRCPDCDGAMKSIKIVDKGDLNVQTTLNYVSPDAKGGWFTGNVPVEGNQQGLI